MNAEQGLFFLRRGPYSAITSSGEHSVLFLLCERGAGPVPEVRHVTAHWCGAAADRFVDANATRLHSGCAVTLRLTNLRSINNEIHGDITHCDLAPERWPQNESKRSGVAAPGAARAVAPLTHPSAQKAHA